MKRLEKGNSNDDFFVELAAEIARNIRSFCRGNYDEERFGKRPWLVAARDSLIGAVSSLPLFSPALSRHCNAQLMHLKNLYGGLNYLYHELQDRNSRELMVKLFAYRLMSRLKIRLPRNNPEYWEARKKAESLVVDDESIPLTFMNWQLSHFNMKAAGYDIELFLLPTSIATKFFLHQYCSLSHCKVEKDDVVIDAGGCWGETALYFAHEAGPGGRVFTFEFIPSNLNVMRRNIGLNPHLQPRIDIVENPLWSVSGETLYVSDRGPASSVAGEKSSDADIRVATVSIDDVVARNGLERVDFIKMDIEGAELEALKGARNTIGRFKPKLAISVYHDVEHFISVPKLIKSLNPDYALYLDHYTIHLEETVLYAS